MTIVAGRNAIIRAGGQYLLHFQLPIIAAFFGKSRLKGTAAAAAAVIIGTVGIHFDEMIFAHQGFGNVAHFIRNGVAERFAYGLAGVMQGKFDFQVLVPVGTDFQFAFADPVGIPVKNTVNLKLVRNVESLQPGPDCEEFVPSLRVEKDGAPQVVNGLCLGGDDMFPVFLVGDEHAVIFCGPAFGAVGPVGAGRVQKLPQRNHLIGFRNRFSGILVDEKDGPLLINGRLQIFKGRLFPADLLENVFHHKPKILLRGSHGAAGIGFKRHVARSENPLGSHFPGDLLPAVEDKLRNVDVHGTGMNTAHAHAAKPDPR